jgi:hypothetical protein
MINKVKSYKFISYSDYIDSDYALSHPNARVNEDRTEVVLSCSTHDNCNCLTQEQAALHIKTNWATTNQGEAST